MWYNLYYNLRTTLLGTTLFQFTTTNTTKNPPLTNHEKRKKEIYLNEILYLIMKVIYKFAKMDFLHLLIV